MQFGKSQFLSANCDREMLAEVAGYDVPNGDYGYYQITGHAVPYSFVERLALRLRSRLFEYGKVLSPREIFGEAFLNTLDESEREVLMPCVLFLIEQGQLGIILPDA